MHSKNAKPKQDLTTSSCQIETRGIIDLEIRSAAATKLTPVSTIAMPKPILSGFGLWAFNEVTQHKSCIECSLEKRC